MWGIVLLGRQGPAGREGGEDARAAAGGALTWAPPGLPPASQAQPYTPASLAVAPLLLHHDWTPASTKEHALLPASACQASSQKGCQGVFGGVVGLLCLQCLSYKLRLDL